MRHPTHLHAGDFAWATIRILVFSQDDSFRFLVRQTFRKLNVREVLSTSVSADGTPMMAQIPSIGLVDMEYDGAMALAFLERVRAGSADMPVLVVAKSEDRGLVQKALPLGIEGIVPKPTSGHELTLRVSETITAPKRLPAPAPAAPPEIKLEHHPVAPVPLAKPTSGAIGTAAETEALKAQLAALTARIGQTIAGGSALGGSGAGGSGAGGPGGGGAGVSGGRLGADDLAAAKPGGGRLVGNDLAPGGPAKGGTVGGGKLAADDVAAAKPAGGRLAEDDLAKPKKSKRELLAEALPEALRPKRKAADDEAARREAEARARWQEELSQAGHQERTGKDVAGLDVDAIVAGHVLWLTSQGAQGKRANFQSMDLAGGDLTRTVLANANFREADLSDAALTEARLDGADFRYASLGAADLSGANLGVSQLRHADLRLANLQGASLRGADLSGARLRNAKLAGADLKGATLVGTDLKETDLSQVDNLSQGQIDKAECDMKTKLPPGVFRPRKDED